ncbi:MAG: tRNA (N6-isopentenyl adenosine(37)-C2)-methylthiotransferase MiaB [Erysipelotrichaceae bacterium]|nr:tRNA (N6-isopentenyl adenosine(37)-C2)-methylthiotransferase MiaB [Erysipelotrichaceae bacterium]
MKKNWNLPDLKTARIRTKENTLIEHSLFEIPEEARNMGSGKKYFLRTYGCQANERDGETIAGILEEMGYTATPTWEDADVVLMNTCAVREGAEQKVFGEVGQMKHIKKARPDMIIAVCGCMAQEEAVVNRIITTYRQVDLVFGTHNIYRLPKLLYETYRTKKRTIEVFSKQGEVIENLPARRVGTHKAYVNIMYGCDKFCTYCIVPYTRGKERSRLKEDIMQEVNELIKDGYKEITLLGQNVNAYGKDLGYADGFANLLEEVAKTGIPRLRFVTSHPWDFTQSMIDVIAKYPNIMKYIHLPVQAGSDEVLRRMGRRYTIAEYKELFDRIKKAIPDCAFTSDIIVGFPNETEEQFQKTLEIVDYCKYDLAYTFIYSKRAGTPAALMEDTVDRSVKEEHLQQLIARVAKYANEKNQSYVGKTEWVLVDGPSKKNSDVYSGYTETQHLVNFRIKEGTKAGDLVQVKILEAKSFTLDGEQI